MGLWELRDSQSLPVLGDCRCPHYLAIALFPAKAALKCHSVMGHFRRVDFDSSHNHKPTYTCYVRSADFKLTKEFCTALSNGEFISSAFCFSFLITVMLTFLFKEETTDQGGTEAVSSKADGRRYLFPCPGSDAQIEAQSKTILKVNHILLSASLSPFGNSFFIPPLHSPDLNLSLFWRR